MEANAAFAGAIPDKYDQYLGPLLFEPYALDMVSGMKKEGVSSVLELACGTGRVTQYLPKHFGPGVSITATDLNPDMIAVATRKIKDDIKWRPADMQELPFAADSFDLALCQYGLMFVPDKAKAIREVARVLKKGSVFHFNTWDKIENNGIPRISRQIVTEFFNGTPPNFYFVPFSMFDPEAIKKLMLENGFSKVEISLIKKEGISNTALEAATGMIEGNPVAKEIRDKDPNAVPDVIEKVRKEIAIQYGDNPVRCPLQAWVGKAVK